MQRNQRRDSRWDAHDNSRMIRTSTAVSRGAELPVALPDCSDTQHARSLPRLHESKENAHTRDATDKGALAIQYYGYLIVDLYHRSRTHLSLGKDSPEPRPIQRPEIGPVVGKSQVGGLHHRYERRATRNGTPVHLCEELLFC